MRSSRVYRLLLCALPRDFRERHEAELVRLYEEPLDGAAGFRRFMLRAGAFGDVVIQAVRLRIVGRRRGGGRRGGRASIGDGVRHDLSFVCRSLWRRPGYTVVAVSLLALGIGATTVMFSVVNGVLLKPLPYASADRIGLVWSDFGGSGQSLQRISPLDIEDYREMTGAFEGFTLLLNGPPLIGGLEDVEVATTVSVEGGFFEFFGVEPVLGRTIQAEDDVPGALPVAMLSHDLWVRRFGGDPDVVGRSIVVDGEPHRVIGTLPEGFRLELPAGTGGLDSEPALWRAMRSDVTGQGRRATSYYVAFGRIRAGATFETAQADRIA